MPGSGEHGLLQSGRPVSVSSTGAQGPFGRGAATRARASLVTQSCSEVNSGLCGKGQSIP